MRCRGMTLIELMVAMSIFLVLGAGLVMFLRVGIQTWRVGERRREVYERGQAILDQMAGDFSCTFSDPSHGAGDVVDVVFLSDYDQSGRQRLRFVRTLAGEMRHPITQRAGELTGARMDYDYIDDAIESEWGILRAPGGLQEVAYLMDPDPTSELLWRGVKSPIGGESTLFKDENIYTEVPEDGEEIPQLKRCRPFAAGILYLEYNFWGQHTTVWSENESEGRSAAPWWDSTGGILDTGTDSDGSDSRHESRDDVFPSRVQVLLVLRSARATRFARLAQNIDEVLDEILVDSTDHYPDGAFQYVRIDDEWLRYTTKTNRVFLLVDRGVRGTEPAPHKAGTPVIYGTTFSRVVRIPGARSTNWGKK